jgi:hypothetical protein
MTLLLRRTLINKTALSALLFFAASLSRRAPACADALATKDSVSYQTTPYQNMQCSGCKSFIPGASANAAGSCKVVAGDISPTAYCVAFSPA